MFPVADLPRCLRPLLSTALHALREQEVRLSVAKAPRKKGLDNKQHPYQTKGTEVDARTAAVYSEQGNIDITKLMVIDDEKCKEHNAKGMSFLHMWSNSAGIFGRNSISGRETIFSREREEMPYVRNHTPMWSRMSNSDVAQISLMRAWNLLARRFGTCIKTFTKSKELMSWHVKNSFSHRTGQVRRKLSHLDQIANMESDNLW